ncbi:MAG: FtsQ-type POTRA domain-containing protein [Deltaproteobacteria bacterium]
MGRQKKPRKNYRKGTGRKRRLAFLRRLVIGLYFIAGVAALMATSVLFVFVYDVITQCDYFSAKIVKIEGMQRLSRNQIIDAARVRQGMNILDVNLAMVRKRLLAQPWIADAEIRREIPAGLYIKIREHTPLAIIDLGHKFLLNENGQIFKEWTDTDPANLPLVSGLAPSDIHIHARAAARQSMNDSNLSQLSQPQNHPFEAVMQVLRLGKQNRSVLSNRSIRQIQVDREIGLTLVAFKQMKTIVLGYDNYPHKFNMLNNILSHERRRRSFPDFDRIDLNNVNRIVVNPVTKVPPGDHKEV